MLRPSLRAAAGGVFALALAVGLPTPAPAANDPVIAVVNGTEIHRSALDELARGVPQLHGMPVDPQMYDQLVEYLINAQLLLSEARKQKLDQDPEYKAQLKEIEERLLRRMFVTRNIDPKMTDAAIRTHYDKVVKQAPPREEIRARHILVNTEDEAKAIIAELKKGGDFAKLARDKSHDSSKDRGGDLGFLPKDALVDSFADAAAKLKPGEITDQPVKSPFGWHVIKLEERRVAQPRFEDVREEVKADLAQELLEETVSGLRAKATIKKTAPDAAPAAPAGAGKGK